MGQQTARISFKHRKRLIAFVIYGFAFALFWRFIGLPSDIIAALGWLWLAAICWRIDRPFRDHLKFLKDWLPLVVLLTAYDVSRGYADNGEQPHFREMIDFDRWLMGGDTVPTVWLQDRLWDPVTEQLHWWDLLVSWVYFSHFVATPIVAVVLWLRNREQWSRFTRRWIALSVAGLITYFQFPAAPPWLAGGLAYVDPVYRLSSRGWRVMGLHTAGHLMSQAQNLGNPIAAMPSLHAAFAMFIAAFFLPRVRRRWWPLLLSYPAAMGFTLVYAGEHWVLDVLIGFLYVGMVFIVVGLAEWVWQRVGPTVVTWWRTSAPQARLAKLGKPKRTEAAIDDELVEIKDGEREPESVS